MPALSVRLAAAAAAFPAAAGAGAALEARLEAALRELGPPPEPRPCAEAAGESDAAVFDAAFRRSRPLVVRGAASGMVGELARRAGGSFAALVRERYGDLASPVDVDAGGQRGFNRFDPVDEVLLFPEVREMALGEFVAAVAAGDGALAIQQAECDFAGDLGFALPGFVRWAEPASDVHHSWLCGLNKTSHAHYDNDDGLLVQVSGSKVVSLVDPRHFVQMRPTLAPHRFGSGEGAGGAASGLSALPSWHFSGADRFPHELASECTLGPGDALLIPALWWHRVDNVAVAAEDGLNVAFNWWFFTDRLVRDQIWPFVQANLFRVSPAWRLVPAAGLRVPAPGAGDPEVWWPPLGGSGAPGCSAARWGAFPPEQVVGRYLARSRPAVLRGASLADPVAVDRLLASWGALEVWAAFANATRALARVGDLLAPGEGFVAEDRAGRLLLGPLAAAGGGGAAAEPPPFPLGPEAAEAMGARGPAGPRAWLARGPAAGGAEAEEEHLVHWQLRGAAAVGLREPLQGLRQLLRGAADAPPADGCRAAAGDVLLVPARWWRALGAEASGGVSVALQWRVPSHALGAWWWQVLLRLLPRAAAAPPAERRGPGLRAPRHRPRAAAPPAGAPGRPPAAPRAEI